jgi:hypothetical protein
MNFSCVVSQSCWETTQAFGYFVNLGNFPTNQPFPNFYNL